MKDAASDFFPHFFSVFDFLDNRLTGIPEQTPQNFQASSSEVAIAARKSNNTMKLFNERASITCTTRSSSRIPQEQAC